MLHPYLLMTALYASLAVLAALDYSLTNLGFLDSFSGVRWLRVHLITLGMLTEVLFALMPALTALRARLPRPPMRWDIWLTLNAGLITLLIGIPLINPILIFAGGTLIFTAASLLFLQIRRLWPASAAPAAEDDSGGGRAFYLSGLAYLLLGIIVGTGLWLRWGEVLSIAAPKEVHIHANNWGFMSLVFAGLLVDLYPNITGRTFAWPRSITPILWLMNLGALGLVLGPWLASNWLLVPGMILHVTASAWLLLNIIWPLRAERKAWQPGLWQLVTSYVWFFAPIVGAIPVTFKLLDLPLIDLELNVPQVLIYGWVLQFGLAIIPYLFERVFLPATAPRLGGSWFSLAAIHTGATLIWLSIFAPDYQGLLQGLAYGLWTLALLSVVAVLWRLIRGELSRIESTNGIDVGGEALMPGVH